jgi:hypothetical protein
VKPLILTSALKVETLFFSGTLASTYECTRRRNPEQLHHLRIIVFASCCRLCLQPPGTMGWRIRYILKLLTSSNTRCLKWCSGTELGTPVSTLEYYFPLPCNCSEVLPTDWVSQPVDKGGLSVNFPLSNVWNLLPRTLDCLQHLERCILIIYCRSLLRHR